VDGEDRIRWVVTMLDVGEDIGEDGRWGCARSGNDDGGSLFTTAREARDSRGIYTFATTTNAISKRYNK
jgi:hypothetical protein